MPKITREQEDMIRHNIGQLLKVEKEAEAAQKEWVALGHEVGRLREALDAILPRYQAVGQRAGELGAKAEGMRAALGAFVQYWPEEETKGGGE